jgi:hypothetical protein
MGWAIYFLDGRKGKGSQNLFFVDFSSSSACRLDNFYSSRISKIQRYGLELLMMSHHPQCGRVIVRMHIQCFQEVPSNRKIKVENYKQRKKKAKYQYTYLSPFRTGCINAVTIQFHLLKLSFFGIYVGLCRHDFGMDERRGLRKKSRSWEMLETKFNKRFSQLTSRL